MDKGPWGLFYREPDDLAGVISEDFKHDVVLYVNGDFAGPEERLQYCEWLMKRLNGQSSDQPTVDTK